MKVIILCSLLCMLISCSESSSTTDTDTTSSSSSSTQTSSSESCPNVLFDSLPVDSILSIVPLGNSNPKSGHIFPTPHNYIYFDEQGASNLAEHNVKSPGDITISSIETMQYTDKTTQALSTDYSINFTSSLCSDVTGYYKHIKGLDSTLNDTLSTSSKQCNSYDTGNQNVERCNYTLTYELNSGDIIGTVGGTGQEQANFDFGIIDSRTKLQFLDQNYYWNEFYYMVCPWDYYATDFKSTHEISTKFGIKENGFDFVYRQGDPKCGVFMQDDADSAKGNWLLSTQPSFEKEDYHIALIESNYDSSKSIFSIGSDSGVISNNKSYRSEFSPNPNTASYIGQDFDTLTSGNIYCYSSSDETDYKISSDSQNSSGQTTTHLRILIYLVDNATLKIGTDYQTTSCNSPFDVTVLNSLNPITFKRDV